MDARMLQYLKFLCGSCLLKAHAPGYESLHFSSSLFSLAFTWEWTWVCAWPCTHTSTHPSLPHKNFYSYYDGNCMGMEWRQPLNKGAQAFRQRRRCPVCADPSPHHFLAVVHIYDDVKSNYCCICVFAVKRLFRKQGTRRQTRTVRRAAFASVRPWKCSRPGPKERRADELLWSCICVNCKTSSARTSVLSETRALAPRVCSSLVKTAPTLSVCKRV